MRDALSSVSLSNDMGSLELLSTTEKGSSTPFAIVSRKACILPWAMTRVLPNQRRSGWMRIGFNACSFILFTSGFALYICKRLMVFSERKFDGPFAFCSPFGAVRPAFEEALELFRALPARKAPWPALCPRFAAPDPPAGRFPAPPFFPGAPLRAAPPDFGMALAPPKNGGPP